MNRAGGIGFILALIGHMILIAMGFDFGADGTLVGFGFIVAVLVSMAVVGTIIGGISTFIRDNGCTARR